MKYSNVCMECHGEPEEFESATNEKAYWMVTMPGDYSPIRYTADDKGNLELNFIIGQKKDYVAQDGEVFMCIKCYDKIHNQEED